jgi:hypothetical protein
MLMDQKVAKHSLCTMASAAVPEDQVDAEAEQLTVGELPTVGATRPKSTPVRPDPA